MSSFAIRYPYFILMACLAIVVIGTVNLLNMPVDLFPAVNIPVVVVATFYSGMPPQQMEADITDTFERFFTLGSGIDHIESRSMTGVSLIKMYFHAGHQSQCGREQHFKSGDGGSSAIAAGNIAAGGVELRCVEPAGLPDYGGRQRAE